MTIDEAIKRYEDIAESCEWEAGRCDETDRYECHEMYELGKSATEHRQLAEWLKELKSLRKKAEHLTKWNRKLIDYKNEIICKWGESQEELQEAKRLLKAAVEDFARIDGVKLLPENTVLPMLDYTNIIDIIRHKWRYADEALELIGDESSGI